MKRQSAFWAIPLLVMLVTPAIADRFYDDDYRNNRFEQRLDRQHWRIKQGIRSGELTRKEVKRLRKQQRQIAKAERRFSRDGYLDPRERRHLRRKLDDASDRIYRLKHNDRYRGWYRDHYGRYGNYSHGRYRTPGRHDGYQRYDDNGWSVTFGL
jgi:hypothetical protein